MPLLSENRISIFTVREAPDQGGLLSGKNPTAYNPSDPLRLWIIQVGIIVCTASLLSLPLRKLRQPKVIAEVLGGIILGPTALGRIPGFTYRIFPDDSKPYLSLVANIGLVLFLFLVGLEIDSGIIKRNARLSATVALAGMILPFGIGAGLSHAVYKEFISPDVKFTHFMLFTGVAYSITAFPVLCRILTELKLLDTTVGIVVLSAGVGNDIVGWTLLALSVALVNAGSGVTAVYILLLCVAWALFLLFPVKLALRWLARKTGSIESGPTVFFMTVTMLLVFGSAFFTDVIGVHAIFGAFLVGLIVPREGGLAITITEKLEDMVSIIFLPLYFTLSGLSTDLGLLNTGISWAYTIAIMVSAFVGKFGGCLLAAHYAAGFNWRESSVIGSLMSCKGLVELIVLNVGLSAGILSPQVFSMFVLEALVLTFMTTPLVTWLYPPHLRQRTAASGPNFDNVADEEDALGKKSPHAQDGALKTRFTVILDKLEHLPGMMALTQLIQPSSLPSIDSAHERRRSSTSQSNNHSHSISTEALRLIELSDRVSAVMRSSVSETLLLTDPILSIFRMFGQLNGMNVFPSFSIVKFEDLASSVVDHAKNYDSDMILLPWLPPTHDAFDGPVPEFHQQPVTPTDKALRIIPSTNPFEHLLWSSSLRSGGGSTTPTGEVNSASIIHSQFVRGVFLQAKTDVALFVDRSTRHAQRHIFLPFFGGPDDRLALEFVVQICTVVRYAKTDASVGLTEEEGKNMEELNALTVGSRIAGLPDTVYGPYNEETRLQSDTADNIIGQNTPLPMFRLPTQRRSPPTPLPRHHTPDRILVSEHTHAAPCRGEKCNGRGIPSPGAKLVVVTGRSRRLAVENHREELRELMKDHGAVGAEVRKTIGDVATGFVVAGIGSGVVVLQAAGAGSVD
ncbi:Sodium/hydrogen exchanger family-domain-containing protein [Pholiota molesta]|nr:Sodium/hydrogen exchanger family-domain-containing protein [Pholiota molesta]